MAGLFKGDQATAEQYQNLLDPLLKETRDGKQYNTLPLSG